MERLETARPPATRRGAGLASVTTDQKLIAAATALLDFGGETAVTLRAVGAASGVSHNAPYKHFKNREALLAAVAIADFGIFIKEFKEIGQTSVEPVTKLISALKVVVNFSVEHPARYRLLFNDPRIAAHRGELEETAFKAFNEFIGIVRECKAEHALPDVQETTLAGLLFATMHGLISLQASGRMHSHKGFTDVPSSLELLTHLLAPRRN